MTSHVQRNSAMFDEVFAAPRAEVTRCDAETELSRLLARLDARDVAPVKAKSVRLDYSILAAGIAVPLAASLFFG